MLKKETIKQAKALLKRKYLGVANGKHIYSKPNYIGALIVLLANGRMVLLNAKITDATTYAEGGCLLVNCHLENAGLPRARIERVGGVTILE